MTKRRRLLLALGCCWPLVFTSVMVASRTRWWEGTHPAAVGLMSLTMVLTAAMVVVCVVHLSRSKQVPDDEQLPWTLLLVLANVLMLPFYWFQFIRTDRDRVAPHELTPRRH